MTIPHTPSTSTTHQQPSSGKRGHLIVITGPSGVGKGTVLDPLIEANPRLVKSISATTRPPRPGEVEGQHYYFVSPEAFQAMVDQEALLEWATYAGNSYGTPRQAVDTLLDQGISVILEIEAQGAQQIKACYPEATFIFIAPPSMAELERRLRGRHTESEDKIQQRLAMAQREMAAQAMFDVVVVNDDIAKAQASLSAIFDQLTV